MERVQINTTYHSWSDLLWRTNKYLNNITIDQSEQRVLLKNIDFEFRNSNESLKRVLGLPLNIRFDNCSFKLQNQDTLANLYLDSLYDYHVIFEKCKIKHIFMKYNAFLEKNK